MTDLKPRQDITGRRFGRLVADSLSCKDKYGNYSWECTCDCGKSKKVFACNLKSGKTQSCGCLQKEAMVGILTKHGQSKRGHRSKTYTSWASMMSRCYNINNSRYAWYGGRGIKVCDRWHKFEDFYNDIGDIPKGLTLDRSDNEGNYEPNNWRFSTQREQCNNKRNTVILKHNGESRSLSHWADILGISKQVLWLRRKRWGDVERVLTTPLRVRRK
jgi:hypothetical protein